MWDHLSVHDVYREVVFLYNYTGDHFGYIQSGMGGGVPCRFFYTRSVVLSLILTSYNII